MKLRTHCEIIKKETAIHFADLEIAVKTYDRNALVCGEPAWRYVYHTIHSADKWYIDPFVFEEPPFHEDGMDDPRPRLRNCSERRAAFRVSLQGA